jgi:hypothetical protein
MSHSDSDSYDILGPVHNMHIEVATALKSADMALFLNHISYWVNYNKRAKKNYHEGRYWTYQTLKELHAHFPYWTEKQLRLIKEKLIKSGILIKGNFNQTKFDQTIWYTIDYEKVKSICLKGQIDNPKTSNPISRNDRPIPDNKPYNKTTTTTEEEVVVVSDPMKIKEVAKKMESHLEEFSKSRRECWKLSERDFLTLVEKYGPKFVSDQMNYMINQQEQAERDETIPHKSRKAKFIDKPSTYLIISCEKNWAKSKHKKE